MCVFVYVFSCTYTLYMYTCITHFILANICMEAAVVHVCLLVHATHGLNYEIVCFGLLAPFSPSPLTSPSLYRRWRRSSTTRSSSQSWEHRATRASSTPSLEHALWTNTRESMSTDVPSFSTSPSERMQNTVMCVLFVHMYVHVTWTFVVLYMHM